MDAPEDRSKALNEHMSSGFAPRADIVAACRHVRFVPGPDSCTAAKRYVGLHGYSITSSAMASTPGGMSRSSALAVLRLITSQLGGLLHWQVGWLFTLEDAADVDASQMARLQTIGCVAH
jgi:hypothetical protein